MKKIFFGLIVTVIIAACGSSDKKVNINDASSSSSDESAVPEYTKKPEYIAGKQLIADQALDCGTCHAAAEGSPTGPAYEVIAKKYATVEDKMVKLLAGKIIKGGGGVYGTAALMTPHPALSQADAEILAKFALAHK
jgi:cytochrome c